MTRKVTHLAICPTGSLRRVGTDRDFIASKTVEAGAELIGANHPMWISLADTFGLQLVEASTESDHETAGLRVQLRIGDPRFVR